MEVADKTMRIGKLALLIAAGTFAAIPLLCQTSPAANLSFEVISINPARQPCAPAGGAPFRGNRYTRVCSTLRMLLQNAYQRPSTTPIAPIQIIGAPSWVDSDRY